MKNLRHVFKPSTLALVLAVVFAVSASHAQNAEVIQRAQDDIARAEAAERKLQTTKLQRADAWNANGEYSKRETAAGSYLAEAKLRLQTGKSTNDFVELTRASARAMQAAQDYEAIIRDLEAWKPPALETPETPKPVEPVEPKVIEKPVTPKKVEAPPTVPEEKPVDTTGEKLDKLIVLTPVKAPATPPPSLWAAADAYFKGDYNTTLDLLSEFSFEDSRAVAQAYLFRSAAGFAIYQIDRGADESVLSRAAEDAKHSIGENPDLEVSPRYFSPKYRAFFDEQR